MTGIGEGVDFSLLGPPRDYVGDYQNAFQVGRALAGQQMPASRNAFAPGASAKGLAVTGPATPTDPIASMTEAQRARAADRADILANMAAGLKSRPYAERAAVLAHMTAALSAQGFAPEVIGAFDASDENLDAVAASARALSGQLAAGQAQGGEPSQEGDGNENPEQPGRDGLHMGDAEVAR